MYVLMEEQMRLMSEEAKSLQVTDEVMQRIVEHEVRMRLMAENMKKQASDDDLQRVEKMEQGLKIFMEEVRDRQKELETRETKEQNVTMSPKDEVGRKSTREGRGCAGLVQGGDETHRMNETCGKGKGKGNGVKGEHGGIGEDGGKGTQQQSMKMMKGEEKQVTDEEDERVQVAPNMGAGGSHPQALLDPEEEAVEEKEGTRKLRWADCEEEEGARQGVTEGEWHKARKEQGIMWLDGSDEEPERHEGSAGGERPGEARGEKEMKEEEVTGEEKPDEKPPGLEVMKSEQEEQEEEKRCQGKSEQEAREDEERRKQEAREDARAHEAQEERRAQEAREGERRAQEARELRRSEREVSAQEEQAEQEREVKAQGGQQENANSVHEECHVSNRHMTWWHNAWWIRVGNGPHMRSARRRRRVWRAARRAAEQARDEDGAGEAQRLAEEPEREKCA